MGTTLSEIAERAGVSTSAVSLALNQRSGVSRETSERIFAIARELNYPIPRTRSERTEVIRFLQIVKPDQVMDGLYKGFIADYLSGLSQASQEVGWKLEVLTFFGSSMDEAVASLDTDEVTGVVILAAGLWPKDVRCFVGTRTPLVFIDACYDFVPLDFVDMNNTDAVLQVVAHLASLGHSRIGIVQSSEQTPNFTLREEAFGRALVSQGLSFRPEFRFVVPKEAGGQSNLEERLSRGLEMPTALFCVNDTIAGQVVRILRQHKVRIPDDVSIVGFDNLPSSEHMDPPLTTIDIRRELIGQRAIYLLREQIRLGMNKPAEKVKVDGSLVRRSSVAKLN